ncbi:hypothetical protein [Rhodoferax sp.]|uniref:hypothetical protein n=1 Tax=Rhodoferax sp. TaxID=50421 RepID=UPI002727FBD1|nr:hypothetical protein [Rhodoferax sp.]MDO8320138.1 hypothetical protein [Rhodoferax sp.]
MIQRGQIPADVVFSMASPMDEKGFFSLSLGPDYTMAAVAKARAVLLEVNPNVPFTHGNCHVHISQVSALVESNDPVMEVGLPKIGPVQEAIGKYVADMIDDGSTLQIGYGGIPDPVVMQLSDKHDLGIHTEMIGDGILTLIESGAITNRKKKPARQNGGHVCAGFEKAVPVHGAQSNDRNAPDRFHQRPLPGRTKRQTDVDQCHLAN